MRTMRAFVLLAVAASLLAIPSTGGATKGGTPADPGMATAALGTGPLANFEARGDNLVRLLAGAFDPAQDPLPRGSGPALRDRSTLPSSVAQYWLVQVRDRRYAEVLRAVEKA